LNIIRIKFLIMAPYTTHKVEPKYCTPNSHHEMPEQSLFLYDSTICGTNETVVQKPAITPSSSVIHVFTQLILIPGS
jgi:hypothetical protein